MTMVDARYPHPSVELAAIEASIKILQDQRDAIVALRDAAVKLVSIGYTRRQVRAMAGFEVAAAREEVKSDEELHAATGYRRQR